MDKAYEKVWEVTEVLKKIPISVFCSLSKVLQHVMVDLVIMNG